MRRSPLAIAWWTVALLGSLYIVSFVDRLALSLLVEPIKAELHLGDRQMGLLLGASFAFFYALFGLPLALLADRSSRRWLVTAGVLLWSALTVAGGFAQSFGWLLVCRLGVGLGEAVLSPAAVSLIGDLFPREKRALPLAVFVSLGAFGASGSFILAAAVLQAVGHGVTLPLVGALSGWRATLVLVGAPGLALGLLFGLTVPEPARTGPPSPLPPLTDAWRHLQENARTYLGVFGGVGLSAVVTYASASWFPSFLIRAHHVSPQTAGYGFGAVAMMGAVSGSFAAPMLADRLLKAGRRDGPVLTAMAGIALTACFYVPAFLVPSFGWSLAFAACATFALSGVSQFAPLTVQLATPARLRGLFTAGGLFVSNIVGLGLGPSLAAAISDRFFPTPAGLGQALAVVTLAIAPVVFLLFLQARRPYARTLERAAETDIALRPG